MLLRAGFLEWLGATQNWEKTHSLPSLAAPQRLHARYKFGFVDEFQDTSRAQLDLILGLWGPDEAGCSASDCSKKKKEGAALSKGHVKGSGHTPDGSDTASGVGGVGVSCGPGPRPAFQATALQVPCVGWLTVVGDDDQSIYGWRDAMPDAFRAFKRAFEGPVCWDGAFHDGAADKSKVQIVHLEVLPCRRLGRGHACRPWKEALVFVPPARAQFLFVPRRRTNRYLNI